CSAMCHVEELACDNQGESVTQSKSAIDLLPEN
ncbi:MAG: hypothetical protein AVDCRST_MAG93-9792, partial [uncultured Chloroflexia bacterium]